MKDQNIYYLITLELGITILDSNKKIISFIKFKDPIISHDNFKNKNFNEIIETTESSEVLKDQKNINLLTNLEELASLLKNKEFKTIEKINSSIERSIQLNKLDIYLESNFFLNEKEIIKQLREFSLKWSSLKIKE